MKKKEKLMLSVILIGIGTGCNLFFTAALHGLLSKQQTTLILFPFYQRIMDRTAAAFSVSSFGRVFDFVQCGFLDAE